MSTKTQNPFLSEETDLSFIAKKLSELNYTDLSRLKELSEIQKRMSDMLVQRFEDNIAAFKKHMPEIGETFSNYRPQRSMDFFCMDNGIPNLSFVDNGDILYKTFDPLALCREQVKALLKQNNVRQTKYPIEKDPYGQIHFKYNNRISEIENSKPRDRNVTVAQFQSIWWNQTSIFFLHLCMPLTGLLFWTILKKTISVFTSCWASHPMIFIWILKSSIQLMAVSCQVPGLDMSTIQTTIKLTQCANF
mgnify:CR=1 FL=1